MATAGTQGLKDTAKTFGEGVASRWGNANNFSKGFLNPTAIWLQVELMEAYLITDLY